MVEGRGPSEEGFGPLRTRCVCNHQEGSPAPSPALVEGRCRARCCTSELPTPPLAFLRRMETSSQTWVLLPPHSRACHQSSVLVPRTNALFPKPRPCHRGTAVSDRRVPRTAPRRRATAGCCTGCCLPLLPRLVRLLRLLHLPPSCPGPIPRRIRGIERAAPSLVALLHPWRSKQVEAAIANKKQIATSQCIL